MQVLIIFILINSTPTNFVCCTRIKDGFQDEPSIQTLDGRFGDGKSEAHGKYSAKEGVRPNQARPQTNIQVLPHGRYC